MPASHLDLISHWHIAAPAERVWAALTDAEGWPRWWPHVRSVRTLRPGGAGPMGGMRRIEWATRLPACRFVIDVQAMESLPPERLRCRSSHPLRGKGIWLLRAESGHTHITCVWRVEYDSGWQRWLAPLLAPLFRWNHDGVMRAGGIGLARHLALQPGGVG
jgi:Polyketide cyclase / dehydrase and lipid transport